MGSKKRPSLGRGKVVARRMPVTLQFQPPSDQVNHPAHYGGDTTYEVIKVAEAWGFDEDAYLFQVLKYIGRAGKKDPAKTVEDFEKARYYLERKIKRLQLKRGPSVVLP